MRYKVIGDSPLHIDGGVYATGDTITTGEPLPNEESLIAAEHIEVIPDDKPAPKPKTVVPTEAEEG